MTDKEMKKLTRAELLEMLLTQTREVERLKRELDNARAELEQRRLSLEKAGDIAHASMELNGVFEAAQAAANQYLENVAGMEDETRKRCEAMEEETRRKCDALRQNAQREAAGYWEEIKLKIKDPYRDHMCWQQIMGEVTSRAEVNSQGGTDET